MRLVIADDELYIIKLIRLLIEDLDVEIVGEAANGLEAYELIMEKRPDAAVIDIRMPGLSGIELIEKVRASEVNTEFIVISGYRSFDFAQSALTLGVRAYLLKPIHKEELAAALRRLEGAKAAPAPAGAPGRDEQNRLYARRRLLHYAVSYRTLPDAAQWAAQFALQEGEFCVMAIKTDADGTGLDLNANLSLLELLCDEFRMKLKSDCFDAEYVIDFSRGWLFFNYAPGVHQSAAERKRYLKQLLDENKGKYGGFTLTIGLGTPVPTLGDLPESIRTADTALNARIDLGAGRLIDSATLPPQVQAAPPAQPPRPLLTALLTAMEAHSEENARAAVGALFDEFEARHGEDHSGLYAYGAAVLNTLYDALVQAGRLKDDELDLYRVLQRLENAVTVQQLRGIVAEEADAVIQRYRALQSERDSKPVSLVKQYVQQNYSKPLTLEEIAQKVFLNPVYLSAAFKQQTGQTFTAYLTQVRLEEAKRLLRESDLGVQDIAGRVGYKDWKHFSRLFIKMVGVRPTQYRKFNA